MRIIYNGIDLFALETHEFYGEPVYDDTGTDYLYTRYSLVVTAVINGQAEVVGKRPPVPGPYMSYSLTGGESPPSPRNVRAGEPFQPFINPSTPNVSGLGADAGIEQGPPSEPARGIQIVAVHTPITHAAIRHRLTTPRGYLYVFVGGGMESGNPQPGSGNPPGPGSELVLASPLFNFACDSKNGPFPKLLGVTQAFGDAETLIVDFAIETFVNEAAQNNARPNDWLLSNRWTQKHSVNEDGYSVLVTEGTALFRTDLLYDTPTSPDADRPLLFMPIPNTFTRVIDYVEARPDVTGIIYGYTDTQVPVNFVAGPFIGASRITAVHRQSVTSNVNILGTAIDMAERGLGMLVNAKWLRGDAGASAPPAARGSGAGTGRLMTPGKGSRPWKPIS